MTRHISDHSVETTGKTRTRMFLSMERRLGRKDPTVHTLRQSRMHGATRLREFLRIARGWRV